MAAAIDLVTQLYIGYFNRAPDPAGLNFWVSQINAGATLAGVSSSFASISANLGIYPFFNAPQVSSPASFLTSVYSNFLGRNSVDAEGLAYWTAHLRDPTYLPGRIIVDILFAALSDPASSEANLIKNKTAVSNDFVQFLINNNLPFDDQAFEVANSAFDGVTRDPDTVVQAIGRNKELLTVDTTEYLTLTFNDPAGALAPFKAAISQSIQAAWDLWEIYFTKKAPIELEINLLSGADSTLASARSLVTQSTGEFFQGKRVMQSGVAYELATGIDPNNSTVDAEISLGGNLSRLAFRSSLNDPLPVDKFDAISVFAHEFGHIFGLSSGNIIFGNQINSFDRYVSGAGSPVFNGPAALAANGGIPIALDPASPSHLADMTDLMAAHISNGQVRLIEPVHVAILQDIGLPISVLAAGGLV